MPTNRSVISTSIYMYVCQFNHSKNQLLSHDQIKWNRKSNYNGSKVDFLRMLFRCRIVSIVMLSHTNANP